jgi:regulator of protease activity HflC (stomatin/prohibitin superfamily)
MAHINRFLFYRHLRAEPNQCVLHYRNGRLARSGAGLAYWFLPLSAAVAQVPVEDVQTTFVLHERSSDVQEITVQVTLTYRIADPLKAAQRVNFSISLGSGAWIEQPLQRLNSLWANWSRHPVRARLIEMDVVDIVRTGADVTREALEEALRGNSAIEEMGLTLVSVQIDQVAPTPELEKALQTPTREEIQQKADEATFQRRALAVEKERAIKENELQTEIELARRQEELIRQEGANRMLDMQQEAERQRFETEAQVERDALSAQGKADRMRLIAGAEAQAKQQLLAVETEAEARKVEIWRDAPPAVSFGLAAQRFADKVETINHLNLTPDLLGDALQRLLLGSETASLPGREG